MASLGKYGFLQQKESLKSRELNELFLEKWNSMVKTDTGTELNIYVKIVKLETTKIEGCNTHYKWN